MPRPCSSSSVSSAIPKKLSQKRSECFAREEEPWFFDKFLPPDRKASPLRRVFNFLITKPLGTDINRTFEPMLDGLPCEIVENQPSLLGGAYRIIRLIRRQANERPETPLDPFSSLTFHRIPCNPVRSFPNTSIRTGHLHVMTGSRQTKTKES